jgi:hypothetical protein
MNDVLVRIAKGLSRGLVVVNFSLSSFLRAAGYLPMFITLLKKKPLVMIDRDSVEHLYGYCFDSDKKLILW